MRKKALVIIAVIVVLALGAALYVRQTYAHSQRCVTYYDKTGTHALYKDCHSTNKL